MPTGAWTVRSGADRIFPVCVVSLFLLLHLSLAAPGLPAAQRVELFDAPPPSTALANPFGSGEEDRRLLQSYLQAHMKDGQAGPELNTREQQVFFLFRLYDFDRSGHVDGLELMKMLSDFNSHNAPGAQANEQRVREMVVSLVDFLLQTQDLNQDGLLAPSEVLSPPLQHSKDSDTHNPPHQEQEVAPEGKTGEGEINKEKREEGKQPEGEEQGQKAQQEAAAPKEEVLLKQEVEIQDNGLQILEETEQMQQGQHEVPVHLGQPEM